MERRGVHRKQVRLVSRGVEQDGQATVVTAEIGGEGFKGPSHFSFLVDGDRAARMMISGQSHEDQ
jgi:hypothetical protein